ncbi:AaceriAER346Wp [[Ashbya] aceris (nom. inval.)]|nr:AaceriAER346Wp [[Ashbya] aceris (nom. inval.)]
MARFGLLLALWALPLLALAQDYYAILGVDREASEKDIKSAYRQLSKKYHPDKNPGDTTAHSKFIEVGEAYEALSDPEKRRIYDQYGAEALKNGGGPEGGHGGFHDPFDIFEQMFGGGARFGGGQRRRQRSQSLQVQEELTLRQYYHGTAVEFTLSLNDHCDHCGGTGSEDGKVDRCSQCSGRGVIVQVVRQGFMTQQFQQVCPRCEGRGEIVTKKCKVCQGHKVVKKNKSFRVEVPPGAPRDFVAVQQGEAEKVPDLDPGDIYVKVSENARDNMGYRRQGANLFRTEVLSLKEALHGDWKRELEFLDPSKKVPLSRKKGQTVQHGEVERVQGFGMPLTDSDGFGDLYVDYVVIHPGTFDPHIMDEL